MYFVQSLRAELPKSRHWASDPPDGRLCRLDFDKGMRYLIKRTRVGGVHCQQQAMCTTQTQVRPHK